MLQQRQSYQAKQIAAQQSQVQHGDQNIQQRQAFHAQYQHQLQGPQQYPVPLGQQQGAQNFPNAQMNSGHYCHIQQDVGQQVMQNRPLNAMAGHHPTVHNRTANVHSAMNDHQYSQQHLNPQFVHQQQQRQVQHQANQNYPAQQQQILQHRHVQHPQGQQPQVQHHINQQPTNIQQVQQHYPYQQHANVQQMQQYRLMRPKVATQRLMLPNAMVSPQTNAPMNPQIRPQMPPGTMLPPRNNGPMNTYNSANLRHSQMQFPGQQNNIATGGRNLMQVEYANRIRHGHTHSNVQAQKSIPQQQIALNNHNSALQNHQVPAQHIAQSAQQIAQSNQLQTGNYHQQHLNAASQQLVNQPQVVSVANQNQLFARPNEVVSSHQQNFQGVTNVPQNLGHQPQQQPHVRQLYPRQQALINQHNQVAHQELVQHQPLNSHQNQQQVPSHQQQQNLRLLLQRPPQNISYQQSQQQQQYAQSQVQQQSHLAHSQFQQQNQIVHPQHSVPSIQQAQQPQQLAHQQNQQQSNPHWATQQEHMQQQNQQPKIPQDFLLPPYSQAVAGRSTSSAGNISSHVQPTITSAHSSTTNQITTERSTTCKKLENIYTEGSLTNVLLENRSKTVEILMPMIEELHMYEMSDEEVLRQTQFAIAVLQTWFKVRFFI